MYEDMDRGTAETLQDLYEELHLTCARAATLLRLSATSGAPVADTLRQFREQEARAAEIWRRISAIQGFGS
jgi:hypothetical protein